MNYTEFKNKVQAWPVIFSRDLTLHDSNKQVIRNQLERWRAKGLIIKLRRGAFLLNPHDRKINPSRAYLANQLYGPSYVSLEYALGYYHLIPERVTDVTSVTTRKTLRLRNELGVFIYQHVKPEVFRGFKALKDEAGLSFFIAEAEKALVDLCYLNLEKFQKDYEAIFKEFYRLQNIETLKAKRITDLVDGFNNKKLKGVGKSLCSLIEKEKGKK